MTSGSLEYTFGLHTCRLGDRVRHMTNPFTGEPIAAPVDEGLSSSEVASVKALLTERAAARESGDEFHNVSFPDGCRVCLGFGDLDGRLPVIGAEVNILCRRLTGEVLDFVHALAMAANVALVHDSGAVALTRPATEPGVEQRWPEALVVSTPGELGSWLRQAVGGRRVTR